MRYLIILFLFFSLGVKGQLCYPYLHYSFDNTSVDSGSAGINLTMTGSLTYDASIKAIGSHSSSHQAASAYWSTVSRANLGNEFFVSYWLRSDASITTTRYVWALADVTQTVYNVFVATDVFRFYATTNYHTPTLTWTSAAWHHILIYVNKTSGIARTWYDGAKCATADSVIGTTFSTLDSIIIGAGRDGASRWDGHIDDFRVYKGFRPSEAQVDSLYNKENLNPPYSPPASYSPTIWAKYKGIAKIPKYRGYSLYMNYTPNTPVYVNYLMPGLDNRVSHDQYMVTYDGALEGDIVGTFDPWYVTDYRITGVWGYSLSDSEGGIYAINSTTGLITIADNTSLVDGTDTLRVNVTYGDLTGTYNVFVTVKDASQVVHVKPNAATNGTGSRNSPKNSWSNVTFEAGKMYVQERGTTSSVKPTVTANGVILAAYGTNTSRPIITGATSRGITIKADSVWIFEYNLRYNTEGISFYSDTNIYTDCVISDVELYSNKTVGGQIYVHKPANGTAPPYYWYDHRHKFYDIVVSDDQAGGTTEQYGLKLEGGSCYLRNIKTYNNYSNGIAIPYMGQGDTLVGILSYGNTHYQLEISGRNHEVSQSYFVGGWAGICSPDKNTEHITIHHNEFSGGTYRGAIYLVANATNTWEGAPVVYGRYITVEDNVIRNVSGTGNAGIQIAAGINHSTIRRNYIENNNIGIRIGGIVPVADTLTEIDVYYNVLTNNGTDISIPAGTNISIYNNTCTGSISVTPASVSVINNFYTSLTSTSPGTNNIGLDNINPTTYFVNWASKDLRLKSTATGAINHGINLGLTLDIDGTIVPQGNLPDIGAYEYITP